MNLLKFSFIFAVLVFTLASCAPKGRYYQHQDVLMIRQIRSLLYEQGFTIGGARQRMSGEDAQEDSTQFKQLVRQMVGELEDVLKTLRN